MLWIIHSRFGQVSELHHVAGASGSRLGVSVVTDNMFIAWESDIEQVHASNPCMGAGSRATVEMRRGSTSMNHAESVTGNIRYGRKLFSAGITGIRTGQDSARGERRLSKVAADAAQGSLAMAAVGACAGLLSSCLSQRGKRFSNAVILGGVGSALGFFAGFSWKTRTVTSSVAHSTARELRKARDERWLELHPIDYA
jgi:hypothetical protein